jgi:hypothetical protein
MLKQNHLEEREKILAESVGGFVRELRLVDVQHYVAFITLERFCNIADIVDSAAEHFFAPGFLKMGMGAEVNVDWESAPAVTLDLIMQPIGAKVYFSVSLKADSADVTLDYLSFEAGPGDPGCNTQFLKRAIEINTIRGCHHSAGYRRNEDPSTAMIRGNIP